MTGALGPWVTVPTVLTACLLPVGGLLSASFGARDAGVRGPLRLGVGVMAGFAAWGAAVAWFAHTGVLWGRPGRLTSLWLFLAWLAPMAVISWGVRRAPRLRAALSSRSGAARLASTQVARNLGMVFFLLHSRRLLPGLFVYPAAWGDIVVGVTAPLATWAYWYRYDAVNRRGSGWRRAVQAWNVVGFCEHLVVVVLGALLFPGALHLIHAPVTTAVFARLPMVFFPAYLVCFADSLHVFLLDALVRPDRSVQGAPAVPRLAPALALRGAR